jgi:hypothetical protein
MLGNFEQSEIGPAVMDVVLHAGDFLYFPRGWIHQVRTTVPRSLGSWSLAWSSPHALSASRPVVLDAGGRDRGHAFVALDRLDGAVLLLDGPHRKGSPASRDDRRVRVRACDLHPTTTHAHHTTRWYRAGLKSLRRSSAWSHRCRVSTASSWAHRNQRRGYTHSTARRSVALMALLTIWAGVAGGARGVPRVLQAAPRGRSLCTPSHTTLV